MVLTTKNITYTEKEFNRYRPISSTKLKYSLGLNSTPWRTEHIESKNAVPRVTFTNEVDKLTE